MSKDVKPKKRIGKHGLSTKQRIVVWLVALGVFGGGGYAAYYYGTKTVVEVPVAKVSRGDFVIAVSVRERSRAQNHGS